MKFDKLTTTYVLLAILGLVATWTYFIQYLLAGGSFIGGEFFVAASANAITTAITIDVYISAIVFSIWLFFESKKLSIARPWLYIILTFAVGLAFALPLYLAVRQQKFITKAGSNTH